MTPDLFKEPPFLKHSGEWSHKNWSRSLSFLTSHPLTSLTPLMRTKSASTRRSALGGLSRALRESIFQICRWLQMQALMIPARTIEQREIIAENRIRGETSPCTKPITSSLLLNTIAQKEHQRLTSSPNDRILSEWYFLN